MVEICREKSKEICLGEHGGEKANLWVCGDSLIKDGKATKCSGCGGICYYDTKIRDIVSKNHRKICLRCVWKNHLGEMTALEQEIITQAAEMRGWC